MSRRPNKVHSVRKSGNPSAANNFIDSASWEKQKQFQTTKIEKKEGLEKIITDVRVCLNKISNKNYEGQRDSVIVLIDQIINQEDAGEINLNKVANSLFDIASTNKFYSELYATLYKELTVLYPVFKDIVNDIIRQYLENVKSITTVDPNVDYDKYCDNNKINDKRKAMTAFIVNLMKQGILEKDEVSDIILKLEEMVVGYMSEPNRGDYVDEITENIFIFITMSVNELRENAKWEEITRNIRECSQCKSKDYPSMSSRAIFKYMDMADHIGKCCSPDAISQVKRGSA